MSNFDPENNPYAPPAADGGHPGAGAQAFAAVEQRPLGALDIVGLALRVFASRPVLILAIVVLWGLPQNIISEYLDRGTDDSVQAMGQSLRHSIWLNTFFGVGLSLSLAKATEVVVRGEATTGGQIVLHALRRWFSGFGTRFIFGFAFALLTCLLIVPGIAYAVYWAFHDQVVSLRGFGGMHALAYSKRLVVGRWWRVFWLLLAVVFMGAVPMFLTGTSGGVIEGYVIAAGFDKALWGLNLTVATLIDIMGAIMTISLTLCFLNLEAQSTRHEDTSADGA